MNEKIVVFFLGYFIPHAGANGICAKNIMDEYLKDGYEVHVICLNGYHEVADEEIEGIHVHRIRTSLYMSSELKRSTKNGGPSNTVLRLISLSMKFIHILRYPITSELLVTRYIKKYKQLFPADNPPIVAVFNPMEAVVAGYYLKREIPKIKVVGYYLDSISNEGNIGILSNSFRERTGYSWERKLFHYSDLILITKPHRNHYSTDQYKCFSSKIRFVEIPLFKECNSNDGIPTSNTIVYAGALSKERRNPEYACNMLLEVCRDYDLIFMGRGDCNDILDKLADSSNGRLFNKGFVQHDEALKEIQRASMLLNIGNKESDMIPSKIFEYIATGKPIIHFYYDENDTCLPYLQRYNNAVSISMKDDYERNRTKLLEFLENKKTVSFSDIEKEFEMCSPSYTYRLIKAGQNQETCEDTI